MISNIPETVYHVTLTRHLPRIKKQGLRRFQTSNWVKGDGKRYGAGEIFVFENLEDARRWAAHMDWQLNRKTGSGKISIISVRAKGTQWQEDISDPLSRSGAKGRWLKSERAIPAEHIKESEPYYWQHPV
jgi:hypothetical protein